MDNKQSETFVPNRAAQQVILAYAKWLMKQGPKEQDKRCHWIGNRAPATISIAPLSRI